MREVILGNVPSKSNSYRIIKIGGRCSLGKTTQLKKYERDFELQCRLHKGKELEHFRCYVDFYYDSRRPDLDNGFKIFFDMLQKVNAIKNDNKCLEIHARKFLDKNNPRIEFELFAVEPKDNQ